ncbi:hypothetical protein PRUPE_5G112600 [Prunus persica]|nr:cell wall / vacuolar inhibitor of fructosidase 1-like [Prunus dulcis]KAI5329089.1 hypothetical protein L3X38_028486 [Prunus dulcis]ONI07310.1 hypothetical protein PRUPE_5G112600 [Prunus persica]VVA31154.1 PREDICTED: cell wall [Prunus dulcis]
MNNLISLAFIFLIQVSLLPASQCRVYLPMDASLIDKTCKQTPNYDVCVSTLNSDPRSTGADVKGLGLIMVDAVKDKATGALNKADELLKQSPGDQALLSCVKTYNEVLQNDVPQGSQAFTQGDSKSAEQGMNDIATEADSCESGFSSSSPLVDNNKALLDVAAVAAAIARTLP